jgi:hypothetical protein
MADYAALLNAEKKKNSPSPAPAPQEVKLTRGKTEQLTTQSTSQSATQSIDQSTNRLTHRLISRLTNPVSSKVMDKPRGFYITEQVNKCIDEAVRYYQEKHNLAKVDRSIIVTALLENEANWSEEALDLLLDRVINQLTNRLTNR